jgi:hypothetical protein
MERNGWVDIVGAKQMRIESPEIFTRGKSANLVDGIGPRLAIETIGLDM